MATDPAVQAAQTYLHNVFCGTPSCALDCLEDARSVVAAVTPLIRAQAFTEAADAIDTWRLKSCYPFRTDDDKTRALSYARASELVRGLGEETASVDSKINTT